MVSPSPNDRGARQRAVTVRAAHPVMSITHGQARRGSLAVLVLALLCLCRPGASAQSLGREVNQAIDRGRAALLSHQRADGGFAFFGRDTGHYGQYPMGYTALAVYTLSKAGLPSDDPALVAAVDHLRDLPLLKVYAVSNLVFALDALDRPELEPWLFEAADWLAEQFDERTNLWGYPGGAPELSNSQFAVMALGRAHARGHPVDPDLWEAAIEGALSRQNDDGGFYYTRASWPQSTGTMTTAGLTTLLVASQALERDGVGAGARRDAAEGLKRGWAWLERCFTATGTPLGPGCTLIDRYPEFGRQEFYHYYYLYGIERVAALTRRRTLAGLDWYADGAREILAHQSPDGDWGNIESTCFALLFLRRATISGAAPPASEEPAGEVQAAPPRERPGDDPFRRDWAYTLDEPRRGWQKPSFDDGAWARGDASFASPGAAGVTPGTSWTGPPDLWVRKRFRWYGRRPESLTLYVLHDDVVTVWIDGVEALHGPSWSLGKYQAYAVDAAALRKLDPGEHVLAAHVRDTGGARSLDVRLEDPGAGRDAFSDHWFASLPRAGVPWISHWLLADGGDDAEDQALVQVEDPPADEATGWQPASTLDGVLDLPGERRPRLVWARTWLHVQAPARGWLWLGSGGGLRAWLDGRPVFARHQHREHGPDSDRVFLDLEPGVHRLTLLVEVPPGGGALSARLCDRAGRPWTAVLPDRDPGHPDPARLARRQAALFGLDELATRLTPLSPAALRLDDEQDLAAWAVRGAGPGSPVHRGRGPAKTDAFAPHPGRRGWARLAPPADDAPLQLIAALPDGVGRARAWLSADVESGARSARVRLGVHDGQALSWLAEVDLPAGERPRRQGWRALEAELPEGARLIVLELVGPGPAFLDELELDRR